MDFDGVLADFAEAESDRSGATRIPGNGHMRISRLDGLVGDAALNAGVG